MVELRAKFVLADVLKLDAPNEWKADIIKRGLIGKTTNPRDVRKAGFNHRRAGAVLSCRANLAKCSAPSVAINERLYQEGDALAGQVKLKL